MQKNLLIGISVVFACIIVVASYTNVVGIQTVKSSNIKLINNEVDQKELLFHTILDMANNREIQKTILTSEIKGGKFYTPDGRFSVLIPHVLTKRFLNVAYHLGVLLLKMISKSRIQSILEQYQMNYQGMHKEIITVIEKDSTLNAELTQLSNLSCDCGKNNTTVWYFPVLCTLLLPIYIITEYFFMLTQGIFFFMLSSIIWWKGQDFHCFWVN